MRYLSANQFEVYEQIGKGGFGVVYRGLDRVTKQQVAIKQIDLESTDNLDDLQKEINILSQCQLKQITQYQGCFVKGYKLWIIMEYLDGGSCMDLLVPGPLKEKYIAILMREMLLALSYLHEKGRIHRDIKAANILLNNEGDVKIADFGVSTQLSSNLSRRHTFVGSPYWMSPEVILEEEYNYKADIWSLGITAIELATGKPPLSHIPPMKVLFRIPENSPPRLDDTHGWSADFKEFVQSCLQRNPNKRPSARRLLKNSRFINCAGRSNSLKELIKRKHVWELEHENKKKGAKYYIPTINDIQNHDNSTHFDLGDDDSELDKSERSSGNISEVVITKKSPLKYSLQENSNLLNTSFRDRSTVKLALPKRGPSSPNSNSESSAAGPRSTEVKSAFDSSLDSLNLQDDVQRVKLQQVGYLLQELDEDVLSQFCLSFTSRLQAPLLMTTSAARSLGTSHSAGATDHSSMNISTTQKIGHVLTPRTPRKAESEKLLLKRWADQYFT